MDRNSVIHALLHPDDISREENNKDRNNSSTKPVLFHVGIDSGVYDDLSLLSVYEDEKSIHIDIGY